MTQQGKDSDRQSVLRSTVRRTLWLTLALAWMPTLVGFEWWSGAEVYRNVWWPWALFASCTWAWTMGMYYGVVRTIARLEDE